MRLFLALLLAFWPCLVNAEMRAVLVGVSDYWTLDADLKGPGNDVVLMASTLRARGLKPENIFILSDQRLGLDARHPVADPTREAILQALDQLALLDPGDTAFFYFSGHGSQQPDLSGDERGGLDEIFLPIDAGAWDSGPGAVENAISDDEFRMHARKILARGIRLIAILDACHSGTGFRSTTRSFASRGVEPRSLGVKVDVSQVARTEAKASQFEDDALDGDFVVLSAAQQDQKAFEYPLTGESDSPWYGDFTLNLARALESFQDLTFRQLAQAAADGIRTERGLAAQTPDAEGTMLDESVFSSAAGGARRISVEGDQLKMGALSGLRQGARVALFADPVSDVRLGEARVIALEALNSTLDRRIAEANYAVVIEDGPKPPVRVAPPSRENGEDVSAWHNAVLDAAKMSEGLVELTSTQPSFALIPADEGLYVTGPDGDLSEPSLRIDPDVHDALVVRFEDLFLNLAHADALVAALAGVGSLPSSLTIEAKRSEGRLLSDGVRCARSRGEERSVDLSSTSVRHCDVVALSVRNDSLTPQDLTVLHIDQDFTITPLWPTRGRSNRIAFRETATVRFRTETDRPVREKLIVLAVPAEAGDAERVVLTGLANGTMTRGGRASAARRFLNDALSIGRRGDGTAALTRELRVSTIDLRIDPIIGKE